MASFNIILSLSDAIVDTCDSDEIDSLNALSSSLSTIQDSLEELIDYYQSFLTTGEKKIKFTTKYIYKHKVRWKCIAFLFVS